MASRSDQAQTNISKTNKLEHSDKDSEDPKTTSCTLLLLVEVSAWSLHEWWEFCHQSRKMYIVVENSCTWITGFQELSFFGHLTTCQTAADSLNKLLFYSQVCSCIVMTGCKTFYSSLFKKWHKCSFDKLIQRHSRKVL